MKLRPLDWLGFVLAAVFAVSQGWTLQEFCWSTWLAGLFFTWACIGSAAVQIILTARSEKPVYEQRWPMLRQLPMTLFYIVTVVVAVLVAMIAFQLYSRLFAFYGLFLSVFAEMQPHNLFGRNGFINSDFYTPVTWLLLQFWPMVLATLLTGGRQLVGQKPWKRMALPFQEEMIRIHVMTLALPFISLLAWFLLGARYQQVTIVVLMALMFLLPRHGVRRIAVSKPLSS